MNQPTLGSGFFSWDATNSHAWFSMNFMPLQVPKLALELSGVLNQLRSSDVWDEISVATYPDGKTGRRGALLSICEDAIFLPVTSKLFKI
jgi:hypothetical protein